MGDCCPNCHETFMCNNKKFNRQKLSTALTNEASKKLFPEFKSNEFLCNDCIDGVKHPTVPSKGKHKKKDPADLPLPSAKKSCTLTTSNDLTPVTDSINSAVKTLQQRHYRRAFHGLINQQLSEP